MGIQFGAMTLLFFRCQNFAYAKLGADIRNGRYKDYELLLKNQDMTLLDQDEEGGDLGGLDEGEDGDRDGVQGVTAVMERMRDTVRQRQGREQRESGEDEVGAGEKVVNKRGVKEENGRRKRDFFKNERYVQNGRRVKGGDVQVSEEERIMRERRRKAVVKREDPQRD